MRINHKEPGKPLTLQAAETPSELIALISDDAFFFWLTVDTSSCSRPAPADKLSSSEGLFCCCGMNVMLGMPTLMPGGSARSRPQTKQQNRGSSHVSTSSSHPGPCRPPLLALLCNGHGRPAAQQREAFMLGHKAHQIQLFWKGWAVLPAPKGYSHALNPAVILLPPVFSLWWLFFVFRLREVANMSLLDLVSFCPCSFSWADNMFVLSFHLTPSGSTNTLSFSS